MVEKGTEVAEHTEKISHRDTETQSHVDQNKTDLCVFVSPWLIPSVSSVVSASGAGS
jgi:hypothetical protein